MRILFVSEELGASELALKLQAEGNEVRLFIHEKKLRDCYSGLIEKVDDWRQELSWAGKDGLIIFDDVGFGKEQDTLRLEGYRVVGGSELGDKIEEDRAYGQEVLRANGIPTLPCHNFQTAGEAIDFVKLHREDFWVVKKNGGHISHYCYVPNEASNNEDTLGVLARYAQLGLQNINLQKRATGVEIGIGRYFNGRDFVGPVEFNVEHKGLFQNDIGPKTPEMGTVMWHTEDKNRLFQETLGKLRSYLQEIDFRGDIDLSCIIFQKNIYPLEFTARFGNPSTALQIELYKSRWTDFLSAIADGKPFDLDYKKEVGVIVTLAVPPFPYDLDYTEEENSSVGLPVLFSPTVTSDEMTHYYFEEIAKQEVGYSVSGARGCVMHVGGSGESIDMARAIVYRRLQMVNIPKMFYRIDIGEHFERTGLDLLKKWGWM